MIIPLFSTGQRGKSPTVTAARHLNLYCEITPDADKSALTFYGTPGLILLTSFGETPIRGWIAVGDYYYVVHRGIFWQVDNAGTKTNRGTIGTTSGRVSLAYNGTQIGMVDGSNMYCYTIASNAFAVVTSGLFANPIDITYQDSYFICCFRNSQIYQISAQNDGTTFDALDFASAESNPDGLVRILSDHGELVLAGSVTVEYAGNTGGQDFPFSTMKGATAEFGLAAAWSLVKFNDSMVGLFKNDMGQVQVMQMRGHALQKISTPEVDYLINKYASPADATALSYMLGGHPMLQINFTTDNKSWLYDALTGMWSELEYGLSGERHRAEMQVAYLGKSRVTDYANGNVYTIDADTYTDNGTPIVRELIGKHFHKDYAKTTVHSLQVDFEAGVGLSDGTVPQAMLQVSKDNGHTWGGVMRASIGAIGQYVTRAIWRRLGMSRDWLFKLRVTDPVRVVITSAAIDAEAHQ